MQALRPGGTRVFYEHVRSEHRVLAAAEDFLTPLWKRADGACHSNRDGLEAITEAGFTVNGNQIFGFSVHPLAPPVAHILSAIPSPRVGARPDWRAA